MELLEFKDLPNTDVPLTAKNLNYNFNKLKTMVMGTVLWTNLNQTEEFEEQTISLDLEKYSRFELKSKLDINNGIYITTIFDKNETTQMLGQGWLYDADLILQRAISANDKGMTFANCYGYGIGSYASSKGFVSNANQGLIPCQLIGYE